MLTEDMVGTIRRLGTHAATSRIVLAFVTKAAQTGRGIVVLYEAGLHHEAQALIRSIFEISVTFDYFRRMLRKGPRSACLRVIDAMMLEKVKQQRASSFKGLDMFQDAPTPSDFEDAESSIAQRYTDQELRLIRRHGFTGLSVEQRAAEVGRGDLYQIVYRNFSRNVHGVDFMELILADEPSLIGGDRYEAYIESRDSTAVGVALGCLGAVVEGVNEDFALGFGEKIGRLVRKRQQFEEAHDL